MPEDLATPPPPDDPDRTIVTRRMEAEDRSPRGSRIGVWILMIFLTPVAAFLAGFCCCLGAFVAGANPGGWLGPDALTVSFGLGVLLGGGLTIYLFSRWLKRLH